MARTTVRAMESFRGYLRPDGLVGTRNLLLIVALSDLANGIAARLAENTAGAVALLTPAGGLSFGEEARLIARLRVRMWANANVGAVLALGTDEAELRAVSDAVARARKPVETLSLLDTLDSPGTMRAGRSIAERLLAGLARERRREVALSGLSIGLKSSASSARSARLVNPAVGRLVDALARAGGTVVATELADLAAAADALAARATGREVAAAVRAALERPRHLLASLGAAAPDPTPMNRLGGLATIAEKGATALKRLGRAPICSLIPYGEPPQGSGLHLMAGPGSAAVSLVGLAAAGATLVVHTVGLTSATPPSPLVPVVKIGGPLLAASRELDLAVTGGAGHGPALIAAVLRAASGRRTASERADGSTVMLPSQLPPL